MTPLEKMSLDRVLTVCKKYNKNKKQLHIYEHYKRVINNLTLPADEYEAAVREIARIIGV